MIPIFPYKRIIISTSLTVDKAAKLVSSAISPRRTIGNWFASTGIQFEGTVTEEGFTVQKIIHNRNSFLPILYGKFICTESGTRVEALLTLDTVVRIFSLVWIALVGGTFLFAAMNSVVEGKLDEFFWFPLAGVVFFYLMILIGFGPYVRATEEFIINLFERYKTG